MLPLSLDDPAAIADPAGDAALRAAYTRANLWPRLTFEQAMADHALAISLRNCAEIAARKSKTPA